VSITEMKIKQAVKRNKRSFVEAFARDVEDWRQGNRRQDKHPFFGIEGPATLEDIAADPDEWIRRYPDNPSNLHPNEIEVGGYVHDEI